MQPQCYLSSSLRHQLGLCRLGLCLGNIRLSCLYASGLHPGCPQSSRHHASPLTPQGPLTGGWAQRFPLLHGTSVDSDACPDLRNTALGSGHAEPCPFSWSPAWVMIPFPRPLSSERGKTGVFVKSLLCLGCFKYILSFHLHNTLMKYASLSLFRDGKTNIQRAWVIFPKAHKQTMAVQGSSLQSASIDSLLI